jgi:galactokinase
MTTAAELAETFRSLYGGTPRVYRAPGRVNLIGEHTDYNEGLVMPVAIDFSTWVAGAPRSDRRLRVRSENFSETVELDLDQPHARGDRHWSDYPFGVAIKLEQAGHKLRGANLLVRGEVPLGSGLSSSAAIEVATGFALLELARDGAEAPIDRLELAQLCQRAEVEFVGMRCGLMDQFISCFGQTGHALMLDCRTLEYQQLPLPASMKLVVCNTMINHELAAGEYNARRAECEEAVRLLARDLPEIRSLRDVSIADLERAADGLPAVIRKRSRHVISENTRVVEAAAALQRANLLTFGRLMRESHRSLRDDFEVSCKELDSLVEIAGQADGVFGARMTGGGFGGCTINLVASESVESFTHFVAEEYEKAIGLDPQIYVCSAAQGAGRIV